MKVGRFRARDMRGGEEVAQRTFNRRHRAAVPVKTQDIKTEIARGREPDMLYRARAGYFRKRHCAARADLNIRRHLPARAETARVFRGGTVG